MYQWTIFILAVILYLFSYSSLVLSRSWIYLKVVLFLAYLSFLEILPFFMVLHSNVEMNFRSQNLHRSCRDGYFPRSRCRTLTFLLVLFSSACWYGTKSAVIAPSTHNRIQYLRSSSTYSQLTGRMLINGMVFLIESEKHILGAPIGWWPSATSENRITFGLLLQYLGMSQPSVSYFFNDGLDSHDFSTSLS